jgi:endonuclease YncB( thermonuclease family)
MSTSVTFKRGTSFAGTCTYTPDAGGPSTITDVTLASDIITSDGTVYPCTITKAIDGLSFVVRYTGSSANWSLGSARWDIKFINAGAVFYSETMRLNIIDQVTN